MGFGLAIAAVAAVASIGFGAEAKKKQDRANRRGQDIRFIQAQAQRRAIIKQNREIAAQNIINPAASGVSNRSSPTQGINSGLQSTTERALQQGTQVDKFADSAANAQADANTASFFSNVAGSISGFALANSAFIDAGVNKLTAGFGGGPSGPSPKNISRQDSVFFGQS